MTREAPLTLPERRGAASDGWSVRVAHAQRAEALVGASSLPASLKSITLQVLGASRLWPGERLDLASEILAHFADGLERGETEQTMADAFGDPRQAGQLMGRAKRRNRPWPWKAAKVILLLSCVLVVVYLVLAARFYIRQPTISHDYRLDLNKAASAVRADQAAWPLYLDAMLELPQVTSTIMEEPYPPSVRPGEPWWPQCEKYLLDRAAAIEQVRVAALRPGLGLVVGRPFTEKEKSLWPGTQQVDTMTDPGGMFGLLLPQLSNFRQLGQVIAMDIRRSVADGDGMTTVRNFAALHGMANHVRETPLLISDLVSLSMHQVGFERLLEVLYLQSEVLSDDELVALANVLAGLDDDRLRVRLDGERIAFSDLLQRMYTNDGQGDGRITSAGLRLLDHLTQFAVTSDDSGGWDAAVATAQPILAMVMMSRRELANEHERLIQLLEADSNLPLWQRGPSAVDQQIEHWMSNPVERMRRLPLVMLMPAIGTASLHSEMALQMRDAARAAIALEQYRRQQGTWPETLDALVPAFLTEVPVDRFDGQPLRYSINAAGRPMLYSVGCDLADDRGKPSSQPRRWVPAQDVRLAQKNAGAGLLNPAFPSGDWVLYPPEIEPMRSLADTPAVDGEQEP